MDSDSVGNVVGKTSSGALAVSIVEGTRPGIGGRQTGQRVRLVCCSGFSSHASVVSFTPAMSDNREDAPTAATTGGGLFDRLHKFAFASSCLYALAIALLATPFFQRQ